jgi:ligand-binding sensor domain-containing protein
MNRILRTIFKVALFKKWGALTVAVIIATSLFGCQGNSVPKTISIDNKANWTDYTDGNTVFDVFIKGNDLWAATESGVVDWNITTGTYKKYTTLDGLIDNYVDGITQDKYGNVWFATSGGVSRFDGAHFQNFTSKDGLSDTAITSITCDNQGDIVVGARDSSISLYNGKTWQTIAPAQEMNPNEVYTGIQYLSVDKNGNIWAVILYNLERYDGKSWVNSNDISGFPAEYFSGSFFGADQNNDLWFAYNASPSFLYHYDGTSWQKIEMETDDSSIQSVTVDNQGDIWCATSDALERYNGQTWQTFTCPEKDIDSIAADDKGNIWCGIEFGPLLRFDGNSWKTYSTDDIGGIDDRSFIACDNDGNTWVSTYFGLTRFSGNTWETVNQDITDATCFLEDKQGNLWFGAGANLYRYNGKTWDVFNPPTQTGDPFSPPTAFPITSIAEDNMGNIWVGSIFYMDRFDGKTWTAFDLRNYFSSSDTNIYVNGMLFDKQNTLWVTTSTGVVHFDGTNWTAYTVADGLADNYVSKIIEDKSDNIWVCGTYSGLDRYNGSSWQSYLQGDSILDIAQDQNGNIWVATDHGVFRYDGSSFQVFTTADGLLSDTVNSIVVDNNNNVWCGTSYGVNYFNGKSWQSMTTTEGLVGNDIWQIVKDKSGDIWLNSYGGISRYTPTK